ncbi:MAG: gluconate 2-dehydrogenase subunit 3 family protein [Cytophagales bacterium]|nr:MAG: gluconate 2-dehydrogenase subunit 3 family protein [Cytophagales bacterium]
MQRRNALKTVAATLGGLLILPAWADRWTPQTVQFAPAGKRLLSATEVDLLAEITETIIPATKTANPPKTEIPGARALRVHQFVEKMVADCYDKAAGELLRKGLNSGVDEMAQTVTGKPFLEGDAAQRLDVLKQLSTSTDATQKNFLALVKSLTIRGYMSSEYVMTNITHYEMAPARYNGCAKV